MLNVCRLAASPFRAHAFRKTSPTRLKKLDILRLQIRQGRGAVPPFFVQEQDEAGGNSAWSGVVAADVRDQSHKKDLQGAAYARLEVKP